MIYNPLPQENQEWASQHGIWRAEFCKRVKGVPIKPNPDAVTKTAGNGVYGFPARKFSPDKSKMTTGLYGQHKSARKTIAKKRKNTCRLATNTQVNNTDSLISNERSKSYNKMRRRANRNSRARRKRK